MFLTLKFLVGTFCFARKNLAALAVFRNISIGSHWTLFSESRRLSQTTFLKMPPKRNTRKASKEQPIEETEILNEGAQEEENPRKTKSKTSKKQIEETKILNEGAQEEDKPKRTKGRAAKEQAIEETEVLDKAQEEDKLKRNKTKASKEQPTEEMNGGAQQKDKPKQTKTKAAKKQPIEETEMEGAQKEDNPKRTKSKASKKQPIEETETLNVGAQEEDKPKRSKRQATKKDKEVEEEDPKVEKSKVNKKKAAEEESSSKTSKRKAAKQESVIKEKKAKKETEDEDKTDDEIADLVQNKEELIKQLQCWGLIPKEENFICKKCGGHLTLICDNERSDGYRWACYNKISKRKQKRISCNFRIDLRKGTFFEKSHLSIFKILAFVNLWVGNVPLTVIGEELDISYRTVVDWASFCREVVMDSAIYKSEKIGGPGKIVEIDESKFGRRKYHRGHHVEGQWVFGGYERGTGKVFMVPVEDRGADTLLPIIKQWVLPGTTVISDYWKAYDCLQKNGFEHLKVNHSINFKDPETGAHTNGIESSWRAAKAIVSAGGRKKTSIPGNLARYMFYKRCAERSLDRKAEFFKIAGELYDPTKDEAQRTTDGEGNFTDDDDVFV